MKWIIIFLYSIPGFLLSIHGYSQDTIIKINGEKITCKVKEIGDDEIKYQLPDVSNDVIFGIDKNKVYKIIFGNGSEIKIRNSLTSAELYATQKRNIIKSDFLTILYNYLSVTYERSNKPGRSFEMTLGWIGAGFNSFKSDAEGATIKLGFKFIKNPDFYLKGMKYAHILKGGYARIDADMTVFQTSRENTTAHVMYRPVQVTRVALLTVLGKQWIYSDSFVVDLYCGLGFGVSDEYDLVGISFPYGFIAGNGIPIAFCSGFRIGFLFDKKRSHQ